LQLIFFSSTDGNREREISEIFIPTLHSSHKTSASKCIINFKLILMKKIHLRISHLESEPETIKIKSLKAAFIGTTAEPCQDDEH
jgi:hypothetical protein